MSSFQPIIRNSNFAKLSIYSTIMCLLYLIQSLNTGHLFLLFLIDYTMLPSCMLHQRKETQQKNKEDTQQR